MTNLVIVDQLPPGEWARHPVLLLDDAYRDGWTQRLGGVPATFPRQLNSAELTAWTRGHAAAHRAIACVLPVGEPLQPPASPVEEVGDAPTPAGVELELPAHAPTVVGDRPAAVEDEPAGPQAPTFDGTQVCAQVDPELFFPEKGGSPRTAKRLCGTCDFEVRCLDYALFTSVLGIPLAGVWGGTTPKDRLRLRRELAWDGEVLDEHLAEHDVDEDLAS